MDELIKIIFGDFTVMQLLGFLWFFIVGYIVYGLIETTGRDVNSPNTPKKWSWKFWLKDNLKRYLATIILSYAFFRFYGEISGHPFAYIDAFTLGLLGDGAAAVIKGRFKTFQADRAKLMLEEKNNVDNTNDVG